MRNLTVVAGCLLLAGCPVAKRPDHATDAPAPTASPALQGRASQPSPGVVSFEGVWHTADEHGDAFNILIFPNGQTVSTRFKGPDKARGQRGHWRRDGDRVMNAYSDGWTDVIESTAAGFTHKGYPPQQPLGSAVKETEASRVEDEKAAYVGVWRLNREPDGSYLYICLLSDGRAVSTINGGTEGKWDVNEKGALCTWPDGWVDLIGRSEGSWQKRSWVGSDSSAPADLSAAIKVGETRFAIEP